LVTSKSQELTGLLGALLLDERAAVAPEYAIVMAVVTVNALGGMYAFRAALTTLLTTEQATLYNYGLNAP
jgi:Flp pilus assembly pilin Flp